MRSWMWVACALVGCASGRAGEVDAGPGQEAGPDAPLCGQIDQLPCDAVYVAKSGNDASPGTKEQPVKTIAVAISLAGQASPKKVVFVQSGDYDESIVMSPGVSVFGGFDEQWMRNSAVVTTITGTSPTVTFDAVTVATALDNVTITAKDATAVGESSFAVVVSGSQDIELRDVTIT